MSFMTAPAPAAPEAACVNVPGVRGPSCDAVHMDGPVYRGGRRVRWCRRLGAAWLDDLVRRLGPQPGGDDLNAVLRRVSGRAVAALGRAPEVIGAAVAVLEPGG